MEKNWKRCSGRTTRLADQYIQILFEFGEVKIKDHIDKNQCHQNLFKTVVKRLN